jgi:hypothetical protein
VPVYGQFSEAAHPAADACQKSLFVAPSVPGKPALDYPLNRVSRAVINLRILDAPLTDWDAKLLQFPVVFVQKDTRIDNSLLLNPVVMSSAKTGKCKGILREMPEKFLAALCAGLHNKAKVLEHNSLRLEP